MAYTIQDPAERAAFERWVDLTAQLIRKYGPALLEKLDAEDQCGEYDIEQTHQAAWFFPFMASFSVAAGILNACKQSERLAILTRLWYDYTVTKRAYTVTPRFRIQMLKAR